MRVAARDLDGDQIPDRQPVAPHVDGVIIATHPAYEYPVLIPLELTPLYSGVRQRFGPTLGGIYVRPFVYGSAADVIVKDRIAVTDGTTPFTLADAIAISGAAPLLTLYLGQPHPLLKQGVQFFPTFKPFSVVDESLVVPDVTLSHGDGGFTDNLGLMPLLARQVRNVIVFVNAKDEWRNKFGWNLGGGMDFMFGRTSMFIEASAQALQAQDERTWRVPVSLGFRFF